MRSSCRCCSPAGGQSVTHPIRDAGRFESSRPDAPFVIRGSYFGQRRFAMTVARGGHEIDFRGWAYPLSDSTRASFEDAGFLIESLREPPDPDRSVPNVLQPCAVKA